jgi:hypothetical protein
MASLFAGDRVPDAFRVALSGEHHPAVYSQRRAGRAKMKYRKKQTPIVTTGNSHQSG